MMHAPGAACPCSGADHSNAALPDRMHIIDLTRMIDCFSTSAAITSLV